MLRWSPLLVAVLLGACASGPPRKAAEPWSSPTLDLCSGVAISNPPASDGHRRILAYTPFTAVRNVILARAPVAGCISSGYGPRRGGAGAFHEGIDIFTLNPRVVVAGGDGRVLSAGKRRGYGLTVEIAHGRGVSTLYAHLSDFAPGIREGASVRGGVPIGRTGRSGNATAVHLHYEIRIDGRPIDPLRTSD